MDAYHATPQRFGIAKPLFCFQQDLASSFRLNPSDTLSGAGASITASAPQMLNYSVNLCSGVTDSYSSKVEMYEAELSENELGTDGDAVLSPVLARFQGTTMALPKAMPRNRGHVFDLDVDYITRPSKRARSEENYFLEIEWISIANGFHSLDKRPQKMTALGLIQPNGHRVEEGGMKRKRKDIIGQQLHWQGARITQSSLRPEVDSQALLQPQSPYRTMGPGIDVTQLIPVAEKVQRRSPEFDQNRSLVKPAMRVCSPKADVLSSTSTSFHPYISKKNVRPPTAEVTTSSDVPSHPSGINLNNAETTLNAALHPHPSVAIVTTTEQHKGVKTERPEHKVTSSVHPKPTKTEHVDKSIPLPRPTVESVDSLHHKLVYIDMVRGHEDKDDEQTSFTHLKKELLNLMTHVARHSNSMQWQHPSDLTSRNCQVRFRNLKQSFSLHEWQNHNNRHQRRFYKLPNYFERSPID